MHPWVRSGGLPAAVDVAVSAQTALPPLPPPCRPSALASGRADRGSAPRRPGSSFLGPTARPGLHTLLRWLHGAAQPVARAQLLRP